ncbi:MAG: nitroreductase family protein [Chloroflexi bacterium]|nr:MAG: nitroreductase family protein [Chloroflexota bacterium]
MSNVGEGFVPLQFTRIPPEESVERSAAFLKLMRTRRTVRAFSTEPVPFEAIANAIATAGAAPSGANQQPWRYVVVQDPDIKRRIRESAEAEERESYAHRMSQEWLDALKPLGTTPNKPHLEDAPLLIVAFELVYGVETLPDGSERRVKHYYPSESMGISVGLLIAALHNAGLATLTHTPSPMRFLNDILGRPKNERPFVILPVGYPAADCTVPVITKKPLDEIMLLV